MEEWGTEWRGNITRPKSIQANISCSSISVILITCWWSLSSKSLDSPAHLVLVTESQMDSLLACFFPLPALFLADSPDYWHLFIPEVSIPPLSLPSQIFTSPAQWWTLLHFDWPHRFPLKSLWKPLWPLNFSILHTCGTSSIWMIPRSATSLSSSWKSWNHSFGRVTKYGETTF